MTLAHSPQTAEDLLPLLNQLPEHEKVALLQRLTFSVPLTVNEGKYTEIYKGRLIEVYQSKQGWVSCYSSSDGQKVNEGFVYDTAEECLETTHTVITWEVEQDEIVDSFKKLIQQFRAKDYTQAGILYGLNLALDETLDNTDWQKELHFALEKAIRSVTLPWRLLP